MRALAVLPLFLLAGCSEPREAFWAKRQQAVDPPQLWSIEVVPARIGWGAVKLCTDANMRRGFVRPLPAVGAAQCDPVEGDAREEPGVYTVRCDLNGRRFGVSSVVEGDTARDFTARYQVTDLDGFMTARSRDRAEVSQTRRYRRIGACPEGWGVGEQTDRFGRRSRQALVAQR